MVQPPNSAKSRKSKSEGLSFSKVSQISIVTQHTEVVNKNLKVDAMCETDDLNILKCDVSVNTELSPDDIENAGEKSGETNKKLLVKQEANTKNTNIGKNVASQTNDIDNENNLTDMKSGCSKNHGQLMKINAFETKVGANIANTKLPKDLKAINIESLGVVSDKISEMSENEADLQATHVDLKTNTCDIGKSSHGFENTRKMHQMHFENFCDTKVHNTSPHVEIQAFLDKKVESSEYLNLTDLDVNALCYHKFSDMNVENHSSDYYEMDNEMILLERRRTKPPDKNTIQM